MKKYGQPRGVVSDGLCSYSAAMKEFGAADRQEGGGRLNNRAENSHQPFRRRERAMQRFRNMKTLQKFSSVRGISSPGRFTSKTHGRIGGVARPCSVDRPLREGVSRYASTNRRYFDNTLLRIVLGLVVTNPRPGRLGAAHERVRRRPVGPGHGDATSATGPSSAISNVAKRSRCSRIGNRRQRKPGSPANHRSLSSHDRSRSTPSRAAPRRFVQG
jgi:hypothetical protein